MPSWEILELKTPWPLVNVEEEDGDIVVRFHSEGFLWPAVDEVGGVLLSLVDEHDAGPLILDLGNVEHMTGGGLEKLVRLGEKLKRTGRRLTIKNVAPELLSIFSTKRWREGFDILPRGVHPLLESKRG